MRISLNRQERELVDKIELELEEAEDIPPDIWYTGYGKAFNHLAGKTADLVKAQGRDNTAVSIVAMADKLAEVGGAKSVLPDYVWGVFREVIKSFPPRETDPPLTTISKPRARIKPIKFD